MKDKLIQILETLTFPVYLQGTLSGETYPDSFFTVWNGDSYDQSHYDNHAISYTWEFDVNFFSTNPAIVGSTLMAAKAALIAGGFIVSGKGRDAYSDEPTHTGRGFSVLCLEQEI